MVALGVLILELVILAGMKALGIEEPEPIVITGVILIFTVGYIITISQEECYKKVSGPLLAGLLLRIALVYFDIYFHNFFALPNSGADSSVFLRGAISVAHGGPGERGVFSEVMGGFFRYFGISRLLGQFMLALCSIVSLMYAAKSLELLKVETRKEQRAMWILCCLPNFAILSSIFLRESPVAMFITLSMYQYLKWIKKKNELHFILAIALAFGGMYFHSGAIAVPVGYLLSRLLYNNKTEKLQFSIKNIVMTGLLLLVGVFVLNRYGDSFLDKFGNAESISDIANQSELGGSSYARYVGNSNNPLNMVIFTIPRIVFFLFSPMPWMIRGINDIIAFCFSSCFYIYVLYCTIRYLLSGKQENRALIITVFIVVMCAAFVFGWGTANTGTACRHRDKMTVVWAILLGLTYMPKDKKVKKNDRSAAIRPWK